VIVDEKCGMIIPNNDDGALVRAIRELQRDPSVALSMGMRGRHAFERLSLMQ
jgi:hypothetical protein